MDDAGRLEAFSDGCLAIFITIMVLGFVAPEGTRLADLLPLAPAFGSYLLSFFAIGIYWGNHHHLLKTVTRMSASIMLANLVWLFCISLVSFATGWMGASGAAPDTVILYQLVMIATGLAYILLERAIIRTQRRQREEGETCSVLALALGGRLKERAYLALLVAGLLLAGLVRTGWAINVALLLDLLATLLWLVPDRRLEQLL
ncbi:MAG: DUF1211 domain-containing protein [Olsenella sp.]|nr:DUF1211 domain-containing protein [Olsenella sp.]